MVAPTNGKSHIFNHKILISNEQIAENNHQNPLIKGIFLMFIFIE